MVRNYKRKNTTLQWSEESMSHAISSILRGETTIRAAAKLYQVPFTTLQNRIQKVKLQQALGDKEKECTHKVGHPPVLNAEEEDELCERLLNLSKRGFGLTTIQVRNAAYMYAEMKGLKVPWNNTEKLAGKDWFVKFMARHPQLSLRKPEGLSKMRAAAMNEKDFNDFYELFGNLTAELELGEKPERIFNVDESGFPLNNKPSKIVCEKGQREVIKLTSVERGENVSVVACFSASGVYIPPFVIFKGVRYRESYCANLTSGSVAAMSESGYINEDLFLKWLQHFQKHRLPGKCLLILDGHASHCSLKCLNYCTDNEIELLCLPPHTTHVLQPLDRTLFKPLKTFYHQEATTFIHNNPAQSITKSDFGKVFTAAWNKAASHGNATKGFQCTGLYPFNPKVIPMDKFLPSAAFRAESSTPENSPTMQTSGPSSDVSLDHVENKSHCQHSPSKHSVIRSSSQASSPLSIHTSTSKSPSEQKLSRFNDIIPTPNKSSRNRNVPKQTRKKQRARHLTSEANIKETAEKVKIATEKKKHVECTVKRRRLFEENEMDCNGEELPTVKDSSDAPCGFCNRRWSQSANRGDWIKCQKCGSWYHEICVGARGKKQFKCGKCV